jgi:predicted Zn-dependent peptidase
VQPESHDEGSRLMKSSVKKTVLPNGLAIVTERMNHVRSVSLGVWVRAGSRTDRNDKTGMAHFVEHMLFKGTERRTSFEIANEIESLGGVIDAFTSRDLTCYFINVLEEHIDRAVDVLSDIICHSTLTDEEIEREKGVVIEEIRSSQDVPEELVQDAFGDYILSPDSAAKPVLGSEEHVQHYERRDIIHYISQNYSSQNMLFSAAGLIDHERLVDLIASQFTFNGPGLYEEPQSIINDHDAHVTIRKDILQSHLCFGCKTFGYRDNRRSALWLINTLLGSGMSSRLFQNIRERHGLTYAIYSFTEVMKENGFFATYAATDPEHLDETLSLIRTEYTNLSQTALDDETIGRIRSQLKGSLLLSLENTTSRMNRLAKLELMLDEYHEIAETISEIEGVATQEIQEVSEELFNEKNLLTVVVTP